MAVLDPREGRPRLRAIALVRATHPNCHLCGHPIDMTLDPQTHPLGSTIDELTPIAYGGSATDPRNLRHAHRCCNSTRGTKPITPALRAACLTRYHQHAARIRRPQLSRAW